MFDVDTISRSCVPGTRDELELRERECARSEERTTPKCIDDASTDLSLLLASYFLARVGSH